MKNKKALTVLRWIGASVFFLLAIGVLGNKGYLGAVLLVLGGILLLPLSPIAKIRNKLKLKKPLTIIISVILLITGIMTMPLSDDQADPSDNVAMTVISESDSDSKTDNSSEANESIAETVSSDSSAHESANSQSENTKEESNDKSTGKNDTSGNNTTPSKATGSKADTESSHTQSAGSKNNENKNSQTVYITKTGAKYHSRKDCTGLNFAKSISETTLSDAESKGLTPCSKCH